MSKLFIPYYDQYEFSSDGIQEFDGRDLEYWSHNCCGIACVRMAIGALIGQEKVPSLNELLERGISNGYYSETLGWFHKGLGELAKQFGLHYELSTEIKKLNYIKCLINEGTIVIASVGPGFNDPNIQSGHLVVINDLDFDSVYIQDPSSWGRENPQIPIERFLSSSSGRGILLKTAQ